jgi:undecaprenyl-diphosphatase
MIAFIDTIRQIDQSIFFYFNGMHSPLWDLVMALFTQTATWLVFYLAIIVLIIRKYHTKAIVILLMLGLAILISDQFSTLIKETVQRLRPTHDPAIQDLVHNVYKKGGLYSFFSSHATNTFALAMFSARLFKNFRYSLLIFLWAALVSYTRIYIGVHYPLDVATGMVVGILIGYFIYKLLAWVETRFFLLKIPKLADTGLSNQESYLVWLVLLLYTGAVILSLNQLLNTQLI